MCRGCGEASGPPFGPLMLAQLKKIPSDLPGISIFLRFRQVRSYGKSERPKEGKVVGNAELRNFHGYGGSIAMGIP